LSLLLFTLAGLVVGAVASMLGVGGGFLLVPTLVLVFHLPMHTAIGTSLIAVIATSAGSAGFYLRRGLVAIELGIALEVATAAGGIAGGLLAGVLKAAMLKLLFGPLLLYLAYSMARGDPKVKEADAKEPLTAGGLNLSRLPLGLVGCLGAGLASGLLGISGGIIKVPVLNLIMRVPLRVAVATSEFMIGITAAAGALLYYGRGDVDTIAAAPTVLGVFLGALLGTRLSAVVPVRRLRQLFAILMGLAALLMANSALHLFG